LSSKQRQKGAYYERKTVDLFASMGFGSKRVYASGAHKAAGDALRGDVKVETPGGMVTVESKERKGGAGWVTLARWMEDAEILILWQPRTEPLLVMEPETLARILGRDSTPSTDS